MKRIIFISLLSLTILGCNSDDNASSNQLNGRWYFNLIIYQTIAGDRIVSSTENLTDCKMNSYYEINNENVRLKNYQSCEISDNYSGNYNSTTNEITIENPNSSSTVFSVQLVENELKLENSYTEIVDNVPTTYKTIQYCIN